MIHYTAHVCIVHHHEYYGVVLEKMFLLCYLGENQQTLKSKANGINVLKINMVVK